MIDPNQLQPGQIFNAVVLTVMVTVLLWLTIDLIYECSAEDPQCRATHRGWRCIHDIDHPGSHRTEHGHYFNDRPGP